MDLHVLMADHRMLKCIAADLLSDVRELQSAACTTLVGSKVVNPNADLDALTHKLASLCQANQEVSLWKLQYCLCVCAYVSDSVVSWLASVVEPTQMKHWFDGHATLLDFRKRFEQHLLGKFSKKNKKGQRKHVVVDATTPQMHAVSEYLLAHTIVSWD